MVRRLLLRFSPLLCTVLASCGSPVVGGQAYCPGGQTACGEACFDLSSSTEHCGDCDTACAPGESCVEGVCALSCPSSQTACAGRCVDTMTDPANCGGCAGGGGADAGVGGRACGPDEACVDGTCRAGCPAGQIMCDAFCVDPLTDRGHCGASGDCTGANAGAMCPSGQICVAGACATSCPDGEAICGDFCVFLERDPLNCGACDNVCPMPPASHGVCVSGVCDFICDTGRADCNTDSVDGCEVTLTDDPANCGACGNVCPEAPSSTPACTGGSCGFVCDTGTDDCNLVADDGCETDLTSTVTDCGSCGNACPTPPHASPTCTDGGCGFTCDAGFEDCNGDPADGCEIELANDPMNCGTCGNVCAGGSCAFGSCDPICRTGPARILVYGPGGTIGSSWLSTGSATVTVANDATWRAMTTADFGNYDVIWIDGANCGGNLSSLYQTAQDTVGTWGPAVRGRIVLLAGDPDLHAETPAHVFYQNVADWTKGMGSNADGGRTSLFFSWGCTMVNTPYTAGAAGSPEMFASVLGAGITGNSINYCGAVTTSVGATHPVLAGITSYWSCASHGAFSTLPAGYDILTTGTTGGLPVIVARESPVACVSP